MEAARELKMLSRSSSSNRNRVFFNRALSSGKRIGKAGLKIGTKHVKLLRDQQIRDEALARRARKNIKKTRKGVKKIRGNLPGDVLASLDF